MKLLVAPHALPSLISMADGGLLLRVLGGVSYLGSYEMMAKVEAAAGLPPDPVRRLAALGVAVAEDAERLWRKLRLANDRAGAAAVDGRGLAADVAGHRRAERRALVYRLKPQAYTDRALLAWARAKAGAHDRAWLDFATLPERWAPPAFPIKAADFIERGIEKGPALGAVMRAAEEAWIKADFPQDAAEVAAIADGVTKDF